MIEIDIDGQTIAVEEGASIIEAADKAGIYIPRFCYHNKLSVAANCRMCLVEVDKVGKPLPACATPVSSEMKVRTTSEKATSAQKDVMSFLLANHPLDCPICDQGGACELQDLAMGFGADTSDFDDNKRAVFSEDIGPLVETEMTRCIHCTRCVRFGEEVLGVRELGATGRGENMRIGTFVKHMMMSELASNVIDLCPVGALTAKPSRYTGRSWEMHEHPFVAQHDAVGSNIFLHTKVDESSHTKSIMRVVPRSNEAINEIWISDRDRFSYEGLHHEERCLLPEIHEQSVWKTTDWNTIINHLGALITATLDEQGPHQIASITSPSNSIEDLYALQALTRALGSPHIDHRVTQTDFRGEALKELAFNYAIEDLATSDAILLIGSNIRQEQPILGLKLKQAQDNNATLMTIGFERYDLPISAKIAVADADLVNSLAQVAKALTGDRFPVLQAIEVSDQAQAIGDTLKHSQSAKLLLGEAVLSHPEASTLKWLVSVISAASSAAVGQLTHGSNSAGATIAGCVPHHGPAGKSLHVIGDTANTLLTDQPKSLYFIVNLEPEFDTAYPEAALKVLKAAHHVVVFTPYVTQTMRTYADIILPITLYAENTGTLVNIAGEWQSYDAVSTTPGEAKPIWKICRAIARQLKLNGVEFDSEASILAHIRNQHESSLKTDQFGHVTDFSVLEALAPSALPLLTLSGSQPMRFGEWPIYRVDNCVRRARSLQETPLNAVTSRLRCHPNTAAIHGLADGDSVHLRQDGIEKSMVLSVDDAVAEGMVFVPFALDETGGFGQQMTAIELIKGRQS